MNNIIKINFLFVILSLFACESLEDTYKDYSGDGKIKYTSKCESFTVTAGWKRFVFNWEPSADPNIKEVQIHWSREGKKGIYTIPVGETTFSTEANFEDFPYTFECYGVDIDGNLSIPLIEYSRPYTLTHELVLGAPKMVNKYFFLGNDKTGRDLVLFLDPYNEGTKSTVITYYKNGKEEVVNVTKEMFNKGKLLIENIDYGKDVIIKRVAKVEGCLDDVDFDPYVLEHGVFNLNFDFSQEIKNKYNIEELSTEFINNLEVLELNYSLKSLEDVMYFPNLKKVILGGNRYTVSSENLLNERSSADYMGGVYALNNVIRKLDVEVVIYNDHYWIGDALISVIAKGDPELPDLKYFSTKGWTVRSSSKEGSGEDMAEPQNILDNNPSTLWHPQINEVTIRTHELIIDMQSQKTINGFKVTQANKNDYVSRDFYSDIIRIEISEDNFEWESALFQFQPTLGRNYCESTLLYTATPKTARYIKITLSDKLSERYCVCLGDFMVF